jgi:predicted transposase/invertase (TIGR01784 family)
LRKIVHSPHDKFFKSAMADIRVAKDFLKTHLPPAVQEAIDFETLALEPTSYVDESLKKVRSDILYQVKLKGGEYAYLYLLCEHQSTLCPLMAFRVWQYVIKIWANYLKQHGGERLPLVYPLVFYTGKNTYNDSVDIRDLIQAPRSLIDQVLFKQTFQLIDVNQLSEGDLEGQWSGMMALMMRHIRDRDMLVFLNKVMDSLRHLEQAGGTDYVLLLLNYCLNVGQVLDIQEFVEIVQHGLSTQTGEKVMTIAEQFIEKGRREGEARGEVKGEMKNKKEIAIKCFEKGFPFPLIEELTDLSKQELEQIQLLVT